MYSMMSTLASGEPSRGREPARGSGYASFLPSIAIEELHGADGAALPGTTGEAAMIFADASGFTALTEKLAARADGAELMCEIMNKFLGAIIEIVHAHCGDVVKFAGDAVSCTFPVRKAGTKADAARAEDMRTAVARAVRCACTTTSVEKVGETGTRWLGHRAGEHLGTALAGPQILESEHGG